MFVVKTIDIGGCSRQFHKCDIMTTIEDRRNEHKTAKDGTKREEATQSTVLIGRERRQEWNVLAVNAAAGDGRLDRDWQLCFSSRDGSMQAENKRCSLI